MAASTDYTPSLHQAHHLIVSLQQSIESISTSHFLFHAPVIDRLHPDLWRSDEIKGLKKFVESIRNQEAVLSGMIEKGVPPREDPLPNVMAFVTAWKQLVMAQGPIAGIRLNLKGKESDEVKINGKGKGKEVEGFVDVIARGGHEWIRLYTKKPSQLLAEFREQDSYINSDYDTSDDDEDYPRSGGSSSRPPALTNSLISAVDSLLALADQIERIPGGSKPSLTVRITRIPSSGHLDPRIGESFEAVRRKGVNVIFGDLNDIPLDHLPQYLTLPPLPQPSLKLNLDPTALMALCSDLLHQPLPLTTNEAQKRFFRPKDFLRPTQAGRGSKSRDEEDEWYGQSQNSRELVKNILEEMQIPLIREIQDILAGVRDAKGGQVELWSTKEAVQYMKETLGSEELVGDGMEQMRMRRLLGLELGDFFQHSRYEGNEGVFRDRMRIRVFDDHPKESTGGNANAGEPGVEEGITPFHTDLHHVAESCLTDYYNWQKSPNDQTASALPNFLKPQRLPVPKVASLSLPFPIVSLITLSRGSREGMTTLMMGNIVLRDLFSQPRWKVKGWTQSHYGMYGDERRNPRTNLVNAAVWMLPYRSLGEGKRVKFEKGDYSYPNR